MRLTVSILLVLAALALAGCAGGGEDAEEETTPAATTADSVRLMVFERSYSECASYGLRRLAAKYRVEPREGAVAEAVGSWWTEQFNGGPDAISSGRDGCLQAFDEKS